MRRILHTIKRNSPLQGKHFHNFITQPHFVKPAKKNSNKRFYQQVAGTYSKQNKVTKYFVKGMMFLYGSALLAHFIHEGREKLIFLEYEHFLQEFGINPNNRQIDDMLSSVEQRLELLHATEEEAKRKELAKKRQQQIAAVLKDEHVDVNTIVSASPPAASPTTAKIDGFSMRNALVTLLLSSTVGFVAFPIYYIASRNLQYQLARTDEFTRRMQKRLPSVYSIYLFTQLHQICFIPRLFFETILHPSNFLHLIYKPHKRDPKTLAGEKYLRLYEYDKKTFGEDSYVTLLRKCEATANGAHPSWYFSPRVLLTFLTYALNELEGRNSSMSMPLILPKTTRRDVSTAERQLENDLLPFMYYQKAMLMTFLLHKSAKDWKHGVGSSSASLAERQVFQKEALTAFDIALNEAALIDDEFFKLVKNSREKFHKIIDLEEDTEHQ